MGKCKQCDADILIGEELCNDCKNKDNTNTSSESYLDSLLNSVLNTSSNVNNKSYTKSKMRRNKEQPMSDNNNDNKTNQYEEEQDLDLNNIFDFMDMVGSSEEPNENDISEDNVQPTEDESIEESIFSDEHDDFNELLSFLSNEENEVNDELYPDGINIDDNISSEDNAISEEEVTSDESQGLSVEDMLNNFDNIVNDELYTEEPLTEESFIEEPYIDTELDKSDILADFSMGSGIGDVFDHALSGLDSLEDSNIIEDIVPEELQLGAGEKDQVKEKKKGFLKDLLNKEKSEDKEETSQLKKKKKPKKQAAKKKKSKSPQTTEKDKDNNKKKSFLSFLKKQKKVKGNEKEKKKAVKPVKIKKPKIEEVEIDTGRISKVAVFITFVFFLSLAAVVIVGKDIVSYSTSISRANTEFNRQRYDYAYNQIRGIELKPEDMELYDKIMTVMFVNKQLNSYHSYYINKAYPEALDSLMKGLKRYDKYIELGISLGIEEDLEYVRTQILFELKNVYGLSEEDAMNLIQLTDREEYSRQIYDMVRQSKLGKENETE